MIGFQKLTATVAVAAGATLAVGLLAATPALAHDGGETLVQGALVGSNPAPASPPIAGINPGAAPWVNDPSFARVREDGRTDVRINGLIIPTRGSNPIPSVVATLVCGDAVVGSTAPFPLSPEGDGSTRDQLVVPAECEDGLVLIQPAANRAVYIAATSAEDD